MLLVDFGERSYKFAVCKKIGPNLEVKTWGVEDMHSLEHGTESILKKTGEIADMGPTYLSFSPAWWCAKTFYDRIERRDAVLRITPQEKEAILKDLSQRVAKKLGEEMQRASGILAKDVIIEKLAIHKLGIDGYEVQDIVGFQGTLLDFQLMCTFTLAAYRPILNTISQKFQDPTIFHLAEALQGFSQAKKQDGVYLDMGDGATQIIVVQDHKVFFVDQVPLAGKDFTFFLQETLTLGENTAKDFKERYAAGDFSFPVRERVKKGFLDLAKELLNLIQESLSKVKVSLPPQVFLFGGTSSLPEVEEIFQGSALRHMAFSQEPAVSFLLPKDLWILKFPGKTNPIFTPLFLLPYAPLEVRDKKRI